MDIYWIWFFIGLFVSLGCIVSSVKKYSLNSFVDPVFFSSLLFIFTFYLPMYFLPSTYSWYEFSEKSMFIVLVANICVTAGHIIGNYIPREKIHNNSHKKRKVRFFRIPPDSIVIFIWCVGVLVYMAAYIIKGIPVLSANIDVERQLFMSGAGFILQPAQICINFAFFVFLIQRRYWLATVFGVVGLLIIILSGWRGNVLLMGVGVLMILSLQSIMKKKVVIYALGSVLLVAFSGIYRAYLSEKSIYGLTLEGPASILESSVLYVVLRLGIHADTFNMVVKHFDGFFMNGEAMLMDVAGIFGGGETTVVYYLKDLFGRWEGGGGLPPTMFGAFFMDFGLFGVAVLSMISAFFYSVLIRFFRLKIEANNFYYLFVSALGYAWLMAFLGTFFKYFFSVMLFHFFGYVAISFFILLLNNKIKSA
ncbi:MAG: O-antigen polymerase [Porticoccaceae bacterium]